VHRALNYGKAENRVFKSDRIESENAALTINLPHCGLSVVGGADARYALFSFRTWSRYFEGVVLNCFLNASLKVDTELNPASIAMPAMV
jgi:hypothetical protein